MLSVIGALLLSLHFELVTSNSRLSTHGLPGQAVRRADTRGRQQPLLGRRPERYGGETVDECRLQNWVSKVSPQQPGMLAISRQLPAASRRQPLPVPPKLSLIVESGRPTAPCPLQARAASGPVGRLPSGLAAVALPLPVSGPLRAAPARGYMPEGGPRSAACCLLGELRSLSPSPCGPPRLRAGCSPTSTPTHSARSQTAR